MPPVNVTLLRLCDRLDCSDLDGSDGDFLPNIAFGVKEFTPSYAANFLDCKSVELPIS
jgi:hypothetical protein